MMIDECCMVRRKMPSSSTFVQCLLRDESVDLSEFRLTLQQPQYIPPREIFAFEPGINCANKFQVLRSIHRPSMGAVVLVAPDEQNLELSRIFVNVGSHVRALIRFSGLAPCQFQGLE